MSDGKAKRRGARALIPVNHSGFQTAILLVLFSIIVATLLPATAHAQGGTATATLSGTISDTTGGFLPGVTVTVTNVATNQSRSVVTNDQGVYRFAGLTPGKYSLDAALEGFAKFVQPDITLNVGTAADLNLTMRVSDLAEMSVRTETTLVS